LRRGRRLDDWAGATRGTRWPAPTRGPAAPVLLITSWRDLGHSWGRPTSFKLGRDRRPDPRQQAGDEHRAALLPAAWFRLWGGLTRL